MEGTDGPSIIVNIPEFRLRALDGVTGEELSMRVVVGKKDTQTPIFNDEMSYLVFSPFWNVPNSIAVTIAAGSATAKE